MRVPKNWLGAFLEQADQDPFADVDDEVRLRRLLRAFPHRRGLSLGAPLLREEQKLARAAERMRPLFTFLAALVDGVRLVARVMGRTPDPFAERVAIVRALALVLDHPRSLTFLEHPDPPNLRRALSGLGRAILRRRYLLGNPLVGLTLNHALLSLDARAFLSVVAQGFDQNPDPAQVRVTRARLQRDRHVLVGAIASLSEWRDDVDPDLVRSAALWQVRALGLGRGESNRLLRLVKEPPSVDAVADAAKESDQAHMLAHTMLVARVDGRVAPEERAFVRHLADRFGMSETYQERLWRRIDQFAREHRQQVDPLVYAVGFETGGAPLAVRLGRVLRDNIDAVWTEIRETGDLALLLAKRASGSPLSDHERQRMRAQLLDVARVVPGVAVFALPGGALLLPILLKLLPFDLRPSSFRPDAFRAFEGRLDNLGAPLVGAGGVDEGAEDGQPEQVRRESRAPTGDPGTLAQPAED